MARETGKVKSDGKTLSIKSYPELAAELKSGAAAGLYLLFGDEEYLIDRAVRAIERSLIAPGCEDADAYKGDSTLAGNTEALAEMLRTPPFLSAKRLVVLKNTGLFGAKSPESPEAAAKYTSIFSSIPDFSCLVFVEEKIDKRKKALLEAAGAAGVLAQIDRQSSDALCKWLAAQLGKRQIRITTEALSSLVDRTECSMRTLDSEVQKILLYCASTKTSEITLDDINEICMPDIRGSIFQMTDAIGARNTGKALTVLDTLISLKEPVPKIRFMLARHFRQLICAKELGRQDLIASSLKVVPFVARNLMTQARFFQMDELTAIYEACAASDFSVKTGRMDDRLSMETLLVSAGKATPGKD
jgi:DNA polymerase-3 subunit delta